MPNKENIENNKLTSKQQMYWTENTDNHIWILFAQMDTQICRHL